MPLPELNAGLVVRYECLWHRRSSTAGTADKDHPACVVATFRQEGRPEDMVVYLPISHTPPREAEEGIELSPAAKRAAGLDTSRQWILVSECNIDEWPFDVRQLPARPGVFHYGHLPPSTFAIIRDAFVARYRARRVDTVARTPA